MKDRPQIRLDNVLFLGFIWIQIKSETKYMDSDLDSWVGSDFKSLKSYGFRFSFGFNIVHGLGWVEFQICDIF